MNIEEILQKYWLHEGRLASFRVDIQQDIAVIELSARHWKNGKPDEPCNLKFTFKGLIEVSLFDKFPTDGYYINFSFSSQEAQFVSLSFNVHDSSSHVYEKDNWVVKARKMTCEEY